MGETLPLFTPLFNKSVQIESRPEHLTGESGALIQREIMERSGIIDWLAARLHDPRKPELITYPLSDLLRTHLLLLGQGWRDQDDADRLRQDPGLRVANSARRGTTPLDEEHVLASQPTLSRLVSLLSTDSNRTVLRQAIAELAGRRLRLDNKGHRKQTMTIQASLRSRERFWDIRVPKIFHEIEDSLGKSHAGWCWLLSSALAICSSTTSG